MTPRREVDMIDLTADPEDIRRTIVENIHSRLPVHAGTPEEMLGVVQAKDVLDCTRFRASRCSEFLKPSVWRLSLA
jgi:putative hemolysin